MRPSTTITINRILTVLKQSPGSLSATDLAIKLTGNPASARHVARVIRQEGSRTIEAVDAKRPLQYQLAEPAGNRLAALLGNRPPATGMSGRVIGERHPPAHGINTCVHRGGSAASMAMEAA